MVTKKKIAVIAVVLGLIAVFMAIGAAMALKDISRGTEPDLKLEWAVVWMAIVVIIISQLISIVAALALLLGRRSSPGDER